MKNIFYVGLTAFTLFTTQLYAQSWIPGTGGVLQTDAATSSVYIPAGDFNMDHGNIGVSGDINCQGNMHPNGSITAATAQIGPLSGSYSTINSSGLFIHDGDFNMDHGNVGVSGDINCQGNMHPNGSVTAGLYSTFTGGIHIPSGNLDMDNGNVNVTGTLNASGDINGNGNLVVSGNIHVNGYANAANRLMFTTSSGTLDPQTLPTLHVSGSTLTLSNGAGGYINTSVTLPGAGGGWVGNATSQLNMNSNSIVNVPVIKPVSWLSILGAVAVNSSIANGYMLYVDGTAFCTTNWTASDQRFKKNIKNIEHVSDDLFKVIPYSYNFRKDEFAGIRNFDAANHYGFIAQEVKEIFPNLVKLDSTGYYAINYTEFIPLLLQTLKEEDSKLKDYESRLANLENEIQEIEYNNTNATTAANTVQANSRATLAQNVPNPFTAETVIAFNIVNVFNQAFIGVYDLTGKEVKKITIKPGINSITIPSGTLQPGMYVYSLVIDGTLIDSKKMVSTN